MTATIITCLVIALAAGGAAATITKAKIFFRFRMLVTRNTYWGGLLVSCPYCMSHWIVFAIIAAYRPRLVTSSLVPLDVIVTGFAIVTLATMTAAWICRTYWRSDDE